MSNCAVCNQPMKLIPAGVSKSTNKSYNAFFACENRDHKQPRVAPVTPVQNFGASLDKEVEQKKWTEIARGKVRHAFLLEAFKMGKPLNLATVNEANAWTEAVMSGGVRQPSITQTLQANEPEIADSDIPF